MGCNKHNVLFLTSEDMHQNLNRKNTSFEHICLNEKKPDLWKLVWQKVISHF